MRLALALSLFATPLIAEDFYAPAPVVAATLFSGVGVITREAVLDLPAGQHRVFLPAGGDVLGLQIATEGVDILSVHSIFDMDIDPELLLTVTQRAAKDVVDDLQDKMQALQERASVNGNQIEARRAAVAFLTSTQAPDSGFDAGTLAALADTIQDKVQHHLSAQHGLEVTRDDLAEELLELAQDHEVAKRALQALNPPQAIADMQVITVAVETPGAVEFNLIGMVPAGWFPRYELRLTTGDTPMLTIARSFTIRRDGGDPWRDIALTLSTIDPGDSEPSTLRANLARIYTPEPMVSMSGDMGRLAAPIAEPMVVMSESSMAYASVRVDNVAVEYTFPYGVTLSAGDEVELALDNLTLPVSTEIHAVPRLDDTAYFMGILENTGDEPLLPGHAVFYRDGHLIGGHEIELIPAGGTATLPFGPVEGLRLSHAFGRNETGDTGILTSANTRSQSMSFTVENLTGAAQDVTAFYPLVFSEQEDLEIALNVIPRPDEIDVDDKRGVAAWHMALAPGETREVTITTRLDWPDGQELNWNP